MCQHSADLWKEMVIAQKYNYEGEICVRKLEDDDIEVIDVLDEDGVRTPLKIIRFLIL